MKNKKKKIRTLYTKKKTLRKSNKKTMRKKKHKKKYGRIFPDTKDSIR
jgi:hypothetical protein